MKIKNINGMENGKENGRRNLWRWWWVVTPLGGWKPPR